MKTGQSARTCLRREVPTDHEARSHTHAAGTAAGKESHDSQVRRDCKPGSQTEVNAKHYRIHTQALGESGPKMDGDVSVTSQCSRALETAPSTRAARGGEERAVLGDHQTTRSP